MYNFLKYYHIPVTIIATKYDKVNTNDRIKVEKILNDSFTIQADDNLIYFSSITKKGKEEVYKIINDYVNMEA